MAFLDLARDRFSERRFSPEPVAPEKLAQILESGRLAPTAHNSQPQRILVVQSAEGLAKMDKCTDCRYGAPLVLVLAYDMKIAAHHPDVVDFGILDTSIAATQMMLAGHELGVHSCWVGLIDPPELRRQFSIPKHYRIISVMPMGYPSERSHPSHKHGASIPLEEMFTYETYADHCG